MSFYQLLEVLSLLVFLTNVCKALVNLGLQLMFFLLPFLLGHLTVLATLGKLDCDKYKE